MSYLWTMATSTDRILFGLKIRHLRQESGLSFAELSVKTGLSGSYLNEIEKGKKTPRPEKLAALAAALAVSPDWLISDDPGPHLAPVAALLRSNFLNELPLDMFGIDLSRLLELLANAPLQINAFVSSLVELAQNHALGEDHFYLSAMRAYQELNNNYFPELEEAARACRAKFDLDPTAPLTLSQLKRILINEYGIRLLPDGLNQYPELGHLRSVYIPKSRELLLNANLSAEQTAFQISKEIGFHFLKLDPRPLASTSQSISSFQQVLHNFKAGYFAVALMMEEQSFLTRLEAACSTSTFDSEILLQWMAEYGVSPDVLLQRFNVITAHWKLDHVFFQRMVFRTKDQQYRLDKELHLHREDRQYAGRLNEEYCRRWLSSQLIRDVVHSGTDAPITGLMRANFHTGKESYLCLGIARSSPFRSDEFVGVMIGVREDKQSKKYFRFMDDPNIPVKEVNLTCERCAIESCSERVAPPVVLERKQQRQAIRDRIKKITG